MVRCSARDAAADVLVEREGRADRDLAREVQGRVVQRRAAQPGTRVEPRLRGRSRPRSRASRRRRRRPARRASEHAHRLESTKGSGGALVLDDTYNSNPAGAAVALSVLAELGAMPTDEWSSLPGWSSSAGCSNARTPPSARSVAAVATDLVVVGRTNRRALLEGAREACRRRQRPGPGLSVVQVPTREAAVTWVKANVGPGDVVLFENDLPDHYP